MNFYNEFDPNAAAWLRELIARKMIPNGVVDERSIADIKPHELTSYAQCHFFAGIGGWPLALQLSNVDPTRPLWTMSCPCQPYSGAGKGLGDSDERNLWPVAFRLIRECRPERVFGEQVASAIGHGWLDGISANLESEGYACGAAVLGAHSVGSPHIRQRLYWVADDSGRRRKMEGVHPGCSNAENEFREAGVDRSSRSSLRRVADAASRAGAQHEREPGEGSRGEAGPCDASECGGDHGVDDPERERRAARRGWDHGSDDRQLASSAIEDCQWARSIWHLCRDGKHRRIPTQPEIFPLADGVPYRVGKRGSVRPALLKGAGNAIVPQVAAQFIQAFFQTP